MKILKTKKVLVLTQFTLLSIKSSYLQIVLYDFGQKQLILPLKNPYEIAEQFKTKPNEICHVDSQSHWLSPCSFVHLFFHFWDCHSSLWYQLSLLCQRFTKTFSIMPSYLATILVFASFYWWWCCHPSTLCPNTRSTTLRRKNCTRTSQLLWSQTAPSTFRWDGRRQPSQWPHSSSSCACMKLEIILISCFFSAVFPSLAKCSSYVKLFLFIPMPNFNPISMTSLCYFTGYLWLQSLSNLAHAGKCWSCPEKNLLIMSFFLAIFRISSKYNIHGAQSRHAKYSSVF